MTTQAPVLPMLDTPSRYAGLYIVELAGQTAVGYTAEEVEALLESETIRAEARVFRIHRATPAGELELVGVPLDRFELESGMFFWFRDADEAARGFETVLHAADSSPVPARCKLHVAEVCGAEPASGGHVVAMIYPSEAESDLSAWVLEADLCIGETVEGGVSAVTDFYQTDMQVHRRAQLRSVPRIAARSREELLGSLHEPIQRRLA